MDDSNRATDRFTVYVPNREDANPALNIPLLKNIAAASRQATSDGQPEAQFYSLDRVHELPDDIPESEQVLRESKEDDLWDSPLVFLIFALLITTEWVLRKLFRLL